MDARNICISQLRGEGIQPSLHTVRLVAVVGPAWGQLHHPCPRSSMMRSRSTAAYSNSNLLEASRIVPHGSCRVGALNGFDMLGPSELALRQGFACGKTLVRRKRRPAGGGTPKELREAIVPAAR